MLNFAIRAAWANPGIAVDAGVHAYNQNRAFVHGRLATGLAIGLLTGGVGTPLTVAAGLGDARHQLQSGSGTVEDLVRAVMLGSAHMSNGACS